MDEKIKEQILRIRETGITNMFDLQRVKCLACELDYDELVAFIEREPAQYPLRRPGQSLRAPLRPAENQRWVASGFQDAMAR